MGGGFILSRVCPDIGAPTDRPGDGLSIYEYLDGLHRADSLSFHRQSRTDQIVAVLFDNQLGRVRQGMIVDGWIN